MLSEYVSCGNSSQTYLAAVTAPMVDLTKKDAVKSVAKRWGPKHDEAFAEVK
ncbi:unnamed protein product [Ectocarpus sp. CCAP 1310/34]|nr:unnamed protein product [Ectocarpus sp. CCAP 1310/34]